MLALLQSMYQSVTGTSLYISLLLFSHLHDRVAQLEQVSFIAHQGKHNTELMYSYLEDSTHIRYLALISFQPYSRQHQSHKRLHP